MSLSRFVAIWIHWAEEGYIRYVEFRFWTQICVLGVFLYLIEDFWQVLRSFRKFWFFYLTLFYPATFHNYVNFEVIWFKLIFVPQIIESDRRFWYHLKAKTLLYQFCGRSHALYPRSGGEDSGSLCEARFTPASPATRPTQLTSVFAAVAAQQTKGHLYGMGSCDFWLTSLSHLNLGTN